MFLIYFMLSPPPRHINHIITHHTYVAVLFTSFFFSHISLMMYVCMCMVFCFPHIKGCRLGYGEQLLRHG